MNSFLIPANSKRGSLILNLFRPVDLAILGTGIAITLSGFLMFDSDDVSVILSCIPVAIGGLLVLPIPNYHNVLCALTSIFSYYLNRRNYVWRGWCFYEKFGQKKER